MAAWATLIRTLGPAIARMMGGAETSAAARGAMGGRAAVGSGVKPKGSAWPAMMHAGNQDVASRAKKIQDEREAAGKDFNESIKGMAKKFATIGPAALVMGEGLKASSKLLSQFNRNFAEYNGKTAASFAQLDVNRVRRDIRFANANEGSATGLNKSLDRLEEAFLPLEAAMTDLLNRGLIVLVDLAKPAIDGMVLVAKGMDALVEFLSKGKIDPISDKVWDEIKNRRNGEGLAGGLGAFLGGLQRGGGDVAAAQADDFRARVAGLNDRRANEFRDRVNSGQKAGAAAYEAAKARRGAAHRLNRGLKPGDAPPLG